MQVHGLKSCRLLSDVFALESFGGGSGPIVLNDVQCSGSENALLDCPANVDHDCDHSEDAGVRCLGGKSA